MVIKYFHIFKNTLLGVLTRSVVLKIDMLCFKRMEKAFHRCIIIAVPRATHAGKHAMFSEPFPEVFAGVLTALVRMMR